MALAERLPTWASRRRISFAPTSTICLRALLARPPSSELLTMVKGLSGDSTSLGQGISAMARLAGHIKPPSIESEFNTLFIGADAGRTAALRVVLHDRVLAREAACVAAY